MSGLQITVDGITQLQVDQGGMTSSVPFSLPRDPTQPLEAATKQYVDFKAGNGGGGGGGSASEITLTPVGGISSTNVQAAIQELDSEKVAKAGDTMSGALILFGDPSVSLGAATKQYVDAHAGTTDWGEITNKPSTFPPAPHAHTISEVSGLQPTLDTKADKSYVDTQDTALQNSKVAKAGDTMTGPLILPSANPTLATHATHKGYVDQQDAVLQTGKADKTYVDTQDALKEDKANKGVANGYASLDASAKVPASQLPAYVDDVQEFANLAAFPATGTVGIIYVALDTNKVYRWGGSSYTEISPSPGSTDAVPEGSVNLYYTDLRAAAAAPVQSVAGRTGAVTLTKADVGLANVDNTSDASKPVSTATQTALDLKAPLASPAFTGNPTAPTPTAGDNDTSIATTAFVANAVTGAGTGYVLKSGDTMSGILTLNGTCTANLHAVHKAYVDNNFASVNYVNSQVALSVAKAGSTMTGLLTLSGDPSSALHAATRQYVDNADVLKAPLASPTFTGDPKAPTPAPGDNDTSIATTAFVAAAVAAVGGGVTQSYVDTQDNLRVLKAGDTMTGPLTISLAATPSQGLLYFGNTGTKYLTYDGTNYVLNGGQFIVNGNIYSARTATAGCLFLSGGGNKYLEYDGASFNLVGGRVNVPGGLSIDMNVDGWAQFIINRSAGANAGCLYLQNGNDAAMSLGIINAAGNSWAVRLHGNGTIIASGSVTSPLFTATSYIHTYGHGGNNGQGSIYFGSAMTSYIWMDGTNFNFSNNNLALGRGIICKAGISGGNRPNAFTIDYAGAGQLYIDATYQGNFAYTSDYRTKKDVVDLPDMWATVKAMRPVKYTQAEFDPPSAIKAKDGEAPHPPMFQADDIERWGFIAHELQETLTPSVATSFKDAPDAIQSPNPLALIAALTKALQEAMMRIEVLEAGK